jgi:predicted lipid-binding transport protein (Tim44 family)
MLEPLLLTIAVVTVPFGLYLAFDRKSTDQRVQRRINRHERTREALRRLCQKEEHWSPNHLRFELRQNYRTLQKARQSGDWATLEAMAAAGVVGEWRKDWERHQSLGVQWTLDPLEIIDVQAVNLQNRPGYDKDFVTVEIETRRREYVRGPQGCFQEGSGYVGDTPDSIPMDMVKEYWTFVRRENDWCLVRCDQKFPESLAFVDEESGAIAESEVPDGPG